MKNVHPYQAEKTTKREAKKGCSFLLIARESPGPPDAAVAARWECRNEWVDFRFAIRPSLPKMSVMSQACCATPACTDEHDDASTLRLQALLTTSCLIFLAIGWGLSHQNDHLPLLLPTVCYSLACLAGGFFPIKGVWEDLRVFKFNVNFLMVVAALGAAIIGQLAEGAILMFLFSLSNALENFASGRTRRAIRSLMTLSPPLATVLRDGQEESVSSHDLKVGDILLVRPGERFAADGVILEGITSIDQSSLTGESIPVDRRPGDHVMAGTINRFGAVKVRMDREFSDTTLSKIFKIVEDAQQQKAPTQRLIDKFGGPYTWIILSATLLTFLGGFYLQSENWKISLYRAMTLMVVASPCALVLSIPSAVLAAIATGAWRGILFKGGLAVETLGRVKVIALDKTGTLTQGKPYLAEARFGEGLSESDILRDVASLEQNSEHPLAQVLVEEARKRKFTLVQATNSRAVPGMGMEGLVNGGLLRIGSEAFICLHGSMEPWARNVLMEFRSRGLTCLIAAREKPLAVFGVSDQLREDTLKTIQALHQMHIKTVMLTGDHAAAAGEFARKLGITDFRASLLPHQKVEAIRDLAREYTHVGMVGDGVNDAPALVSAPVGIAMGGSGSDAALENADVVLMADDIGRIPEIVMLGRKTHTIIRQNLIFAVGVMLLLVASTFLSKISLAEGVIGHEGSTVLVVFNSLRLLRLRKQAVV